MPSPRHPRKAASGTGEQQPGPLPQLLDMSGLALAAVADDGTVLFASTAFAALLGEGPDQIVGVKLPDLGVGERGDLATFWNYGLSSYINRPWPVTLRRLEGDGEVRMLLSVAHAAGGDDLLVRAIPIARERGSGHEPAAGVPAATLSNARADEAPVRGLVATFTQDLRTGMSWVVSEAMYEIFGDPVPEPGLHEYSGFHFESAVHPEDLPGLADIIERSWLAPTRVNVVFRIVRPDKELRLVRVVGQTFADPETGAMVRSSGVVIDITDDDLRLRVSRTSDDMLRVGEKATSFDELFDGTCWAAISRGAADFCGYWRVLDGVELVASAGSDRWIADELAYHVQAAARTGEVSLAAPDGAPAGTSITGFASPVRVAGSVVGVVGVWSSNPRVWDAVPTGAAASVGVQVADAIERIVRQSRHPVVQ